MFKQFNPNSERHEHTHTHTFHFNSLQFCGILFYHYYYALLLLLLLLFQWCIIVIINVDTKHIWNSIGSIWRFGTYYNMAYMQSLTYRHWIHHCYYAIECDMLFLIWRKENSTKMYKQFQNHQFFGCCWIKIFFYWNETANVNNVDISLSHIEVADIHILLTCSMCQRIEFWQNVCKGFSIKNMEFADFNVIINCRCLCIVC